MILMRFLSHNYNETSMTPLELEIAYHLNEMEYDPEVFEYLLWVDADTEVRPDALSHLVSHMAKDIQIAGLCGETLLRNESESVTTMVQPYEYFISHHLAKSFESLFNTVTCLPGCFCMYRIHSPQEHKAVLCSSAVINSYGDQDTSTLHLKNLLTLGEDRYLTTLMLKNFPEMKLKFTSTAKALTTAPNSWRVLLSQRRRCKM